MEDFSIEWDHWPVLICDLRAEMTAPSMARYTAALAEAIARHQRFATVFLSIAPGFKFDRRLFKPMAELANAHQEELAQYCLGTAAVLGSPAYRFMLSSFLLLVRTPNPIKVFPAPEPAREWLDELLAGAGLPSPPGLAGRLVSTPAK